jgi:hypothetical protein
MQRLSPSPRGWPAWSLVDGHQQEARGRKFRPEKLIGLAPEVQQVEAIDDPAVSVDYLIVQPVASFGRTVGHRFLGSLGAEVSKLQLPAVAKRS